MSVVPSVDLELARKELKAQLKAYKSSMEPDVYKQTLDNLLLKRIA